MKEFVKPILVLSKCIEFEECRYDGRIISSDLVRKLIPYVQFITVCPEVEIGLGTPRKPLRLVSINGQLRLLQPAANLDHTEKMQSFASSFLDSLPEVDGFLLKGKSPTSALRDARVYSGTNPGAAIVTKGPGLFGGAILEEHPCLAIEDEGRLRNPRIKEHFLTKLFTLASFRTMKEENSHDSLVEFHSKNMILFKAYNQKELRILGGIAAKKQKKSIGRVIEDYQQHLCYVLKRPPRCGSNLNVMMHIMGYFSDKLSKEEKSFFLESLQKYRDGVLPSSVNITMLRLWLRKFREDYLLRQTFFEPYPTELMDIETMTAYCDGKDYWK
ncbi:MAG: DUF1722 domain-containing protein [Candidatus Bathyarchaeota archaeon]|nr:MAG: DUF1722 domain-containing protein [Candidatus Bathyarchaeota archaeon]